MTDMKNENNVNDASLPENTNAASDVSKKDELGKYWLVIIWCSLFVPFVGGWVIVLLSSAMYYAWRKNSPKKAKKINKHGWLAFIVGQIIGVLLFISLASLGGGKNFGKESDVKASQTKEYVSIQKCAKKILTGVAQKKWGTLAPTCVSVKIDSKLSDDTYTATALLDDGESMRVKIQIKGHRMAVSRL